MKNNDSPSKDFYSQDDGQAGSIGHLHNLFSQQSSGLSTTSIDEDTDAAATTNTSEHPLQRKRTQKGSNTTKASTERTGLLEAYNNDGMNGSFVNRSVRRLSANNNSATLLDMFQTPAPSSTEKTPKMGPSGRKFLGSSPMAATATGQSGDESNHHHHNDPLGNNHIDREGSNLRHPNLNHNHTSKETASFRDRTKSMCEEAGRELMSPTTWIGSFMFVLYHVVFCLASGSAILRPYAKNSILGLMTKMAALGIIFSGPVYLYNIGNDIPPMYPTCDLFLAPILAHIAKLIDEVRRQRNNQCIILLGSFLCHILIYYVLYYLFC